jgi:hypothetical protein
MSKPKMVSPEMVEVMAQFVRDCTRLKYHVIGFVFETKPLAIGLVRNISGECVPVLHLLTQTLEDCQISGKVVDVPVVKPS